MVEYSSRKIVAQLPNTLEANTVYYVRVGEGFDLYVSDSTGSIAHKINGGASNNYALSVAWGN